MNENIKNPLDNFNIKIFCINLQNRSYDYLLQYRKRFTNKQINKIFYNRQRRNNAHRVTYI